MNRNETDLIHGSLWNKIPLFALPVAATAILKQLFNASDVAVVGNFTGADSTAAVAAVGANSPITGLILNLFIGIALGANVVIATAIGRGDHETVGRAVHTAILMALTFSGVLNFLMNLFFVIVLNMTVNGVAIATVISNAVSSLLLLYRLTHTSMAIRVSAHALHFDRASFAKIVQIGLPAGIQSAVFSFANIIVQSAINSLGTVVIAASSAAYNIEITAYYMFNSFSQACTTFVGQNYGARQPDRCRRTFVFCLLEDVLVTVTFMSVVLHFGHVLLALFNRDPEVIALGYTRLSIIFFGYIFSLLYELVSGYLRGFGISLVLAVLTTLGVCGVMGAGGLPAPCGFPDPDAGLSAQPVCHSGADAGGAHRLPPDEPNETTIQKGNLCMNTDPITLNNGVTMPRIGYGVFHMTDAATCKV